MRLASPSPWPLVLVFSTVLQMVVGELAPKNLAIARPIPLARALSRSTLIYLAVAGPLIRLFDAASNRLLRAVGIEPVEELSPGATTEDLEHVIDESRKGGALDEDLSLLLERGLAYRALSAGAGDDPSGRRRHRAGHRDRWRTSSTSCAPARTRGSPSWPQDVDDVVGIVGLAELLEVPRTRWGSVTVQDACSAAVVVPGSLPLPAVLEQLRSSRRQLAVVVDEFGGFDGVLTLEDIAEEVVGDIFDEGDEREPEPPAGPADTHTLSARLPPRRGRVVDRHPAAARSGLRHRQRPRAGPARAGSAETGDTVMVDEVVEPGDVDDLVGARPDRDPRRRGRATRPCGGDAAAPPVGSRPGAGLVNVAVSVGLSVLLLLANAFFVAAEFAVVSAKRHRLEVAAAFGGRSAPGGRAQQPRALPGSGRRAARDHARDAGARRAGQAGGRRPARPPAPADPVAGGRWPRSSPRSSRVAVVVFLHMVVGEMAPKSWAISHPERSAILLGLPFRVLHGVDPMGASSCSTASPTPCSGSGRSSRSMRPASCRDRPSCGCSSTRPGSTASSRRRTSSCSAASSTWPARRCMRRRCPWPTSWRVPADALAVDVERRSRESGRSRLVVLDASGAPTGLVHVRDAVLARARHHRSPTSPTPRPCSTPTPSVVEAIGRMRADRAQLALVVDTDGEVIGITALEDLLERVLGEFDDETDRPRR